MNPACVMSRAERIAYWEGKKTQEINQILHAVCNNQDVKKNPMLLFSFLNVCNVFSQSEDYELSKMTHLQISKGL